MSTPPWSLRPPTCEPELWLVIGKPAQKAMRAEWQADDPDALAAQEERRSSWRRAKRGGVVACGVVAGSGELPGSSSACVPRALAVRAINDDPAVSTWSCAVPRIQGWLPLWLSTLWQSELPLLKTFGWRVCGARCTVC